MRLFKKKKDPNEIKPQIIPHSAYKQQAQGNVLHSAQGVFPVANTAGKANRTQSTGDYMIKTPRLTVQQNTNTMAKPRSENAADADQYLSTRNNTINRSSALYNSNRSN